MHQLVPMMICLVVWSIQKACQRIQRAWPNTGKSNPYVPHSDGTEVMMPYGIHFDFEQY